MRRVLYSAVEKLTRWVRFTVAMGLNERAARMQGSSCLHISHSVEEVEFAIFMAVDRESPIRLRARPMSIRRTERHLHVTFDACFYVAPYLGGPYRSALVC